MLAGWNTSRRTTLTAVAAAALCWAAAAHAQCRGDLTGDGVVDGADLGALLTAWGSTGGFADVTGDGVVDGADLGALLVDWGPCGAGTVRAWGAGTTNNGGDFNYGQSIVPPDLGACLAIAAGEFHTVALHSDGSVSAWGSNWEGQCNVPSNVGSCIAIAAGEFHTIALRDDGTVRAWGAGNSGWPNYGQSVVPVDLGPCSAIAGGLLHTVALRNDGTVRAWGNNFLGQCTIPTNVGPCSDIAAGGLHTIALRTDGTVRAWGNNDAGQCTIPTNLGSCSAVAGGYYHSIALRTDGTVRAWGAGITNTGSLPNYGQSIIPENLGPCTAVAGGYYHTIALCTDGTVRAWGNNFLGQCTIPTNLAPCSAIAGGGLHTVAIKSPITPAWAELIEALPDPAVVTDPNLRAAITETGLAWRVKDKATQIEMVLIPPGAFQMGCTASQQTSCNPNENPVHTVSLNYPFYMGRYEVTQAQWQSVMGSNPSFFQGPSGEVPVDQIPNRPVEQVTWNMIQGFLRAGMRLPTEAEWEYAYRAGTTTAFHGFTGFASGTNDDNLLGNIAWNYLNAASQTRIVGRKLGNGYGLHDMAGNVWELVNDWFDSSYYSSSPQNDPPGPTTGTYRVVRGGGWRFVNSCRASRRISYSPSSPINDIGFRVARTP